MPRCLRWNPSPCWLLLLSSFLSFFWNQGLAAQPAFVDVDLPFGDINVLVLTDVHSWVGGHGSNEPGQNANYGNVLSFYQRVHDHCASKGMDLWFVVNGDWIDGTGLSLNGNIEYLTPLLERMPWDALNVGNHELYKDKVVTDFMRPGGFVEWWGDRYLSSNVRHVQRQQPLGERYRFLRGKNSTTLVFGFLYNMKDHSPIVEVEEVEQVVEERWFQDVIENSNGDSDGQYDAIMVLAHMDVKDRLVTVVLNKIRSLVEDPMPVQFVTGHTHYRGVHIMDDAAVSFEAGRFLDTIGFVSFPKQQTLLKGLTNRELQNDGEQPNITDTNSSTPDTTEPTSSPTTTSTIPPNSNNPVTSSPQSTTTAPSPIMATLFCHRFIDANVDTLKSIVRGPYFDTEDGTRLSQFIQRTRSELGLLDLAGCAPRSYYLNRTVTEKDSLWRLFLEDIAPFELLKMPANADPNRQKMFLAGFGGLRYDLIGRRLIVDDVIAVSPFNESIYALGPEIPGWALKEVITDVLNSNHSDDGFVMSPPLEELQPNIMYEILAPEWGVKYILEGFQETQYNGTIKQQETTYTTTHVWLDYIKKKWVCKHEDVQDHHDHYSTQNGGSGSESRDKPTSPFEDPNSAEKDQRRFIMAMVAVGCVLVLGSLYICQLHGSWLQRYSDRQRVIFEADAEFIGSEENELI